MVGLYFYFCFDMSSSTNDKGSTFRKVRAMGALSVQAIPDLCTKLSIFGYRRLALADDDDDDDNMF